MFDIEGNLCVIASVNLQMIQYINSNKYLLKSLIKIDINFVLDMSRRNIESANYDGAVKLIKVPLDIKESIKRFSSTYEQRQADNNNNLVRHTVTSDRCLICEQFFAQQEMQILGVCKHTYCLECLHNYILYKITVSEEIECPQSDCKEIISKKQKSYTEVPARYKTLYQKYKLSKQTYGNTTKIFCLAPNCKGVIDPSQMKCDTCKLQVCKKCHLKKHTGSCDNAYNNNFVQWRLCAECKKFTQIDPKKSDNKIKCQCGHQYCLVCRQNWSEAHQRCSQHVDTSLQDDVFCRNSIMNSNRCFNFIRSILLIICIPFVIILILFAIILTVIGSTFAAILFSPCLSFMEFDSKARAIFCFPCVGVYKIGQFIKRYVGTVCSIGCDFLGRLMMTIKALCCYDRSKLQSEGTKIQYVN